MPTLFDSLLKLSVNLAETGLLVMDSALRTAQAGIGSLVGQQPVEPLKPPIEGPVDLDGAFGELRGGLAMAGRDRDQTELGMAGGEAVQVVVIADAV